MSMAAAVAIGLANTFSHSEKTRKAGCRPMPAEYETLPIAGFLLPIRGPAQDANTISHPKSPD